ncbi:SIR2 family protein [Stutzerimonas nitrititolerans]|uniref:SIR2 family protein n=1 Tax=Stutzerimonas nitrititolerans TaxID=2482751 RepID=UPI0028965E3D|nr:SIR2 family protein [Stutzerimonas nitrititolerans]
MVNWPASLIREIAERRVIFFIGSGLSKAAHNNLPTWPKLLEKLSEDIPTRKTRELIKQLIKQGKMLDAAQIIHDALPKADMNAKLRATFQVRPIPNSEIYNDLLQMDPKTIVTTNYDELLEKNFEHFSQGNEAHSICDHKASKLVTDLRSPIRSIVKMHGCITNPSDVVLDRSSYFKAKRDNPGLFNTITSLMTVNTVLFLGYSINDPDIQLILENINIYSNSDHPHYALMSKFEHQSIRLAMKETFNVEFVEYPSGQHQMVPDAVSRLRESVTSLRAIRGIV